MNVLRSYGVYFAWVLSLTGFFMSLYFSEVEQIDPCRFCWMQRIALFPLVIQLGVASFYSEAGKAFRYCFPLAFLGFGVASYQSLLPEFKLGHSCHCEASSLPLLFEKFPLPWVSAGGFLAIMLFLLISRSQKTD